MEGREDEAKLEIKADVAGFLKWATGMCFTKSHTTSNKFGKLERWTTQHE